MSGRRGRGRGGGGRGGGYNNDQFGNNGGGGNYNQQWGGQQQRGGYNSNAFGSQRGRGGTGGRRGGRSAPNYEDLALQHPEVQFINRHHNHQQAVTCICFDSRAGAETLYTGSQDGFVNVYNYRPDGARKKFEEGTPFQNAMQGPVTGMVCLDGGQLCVAYTEGAAGTLFCPNTGQKLQLHQGAVQSLIVSTQSPPVIWTGGQDCKISAVALQAQPQASPQALPQYAMAVQGQLGPEIGGHGGGVTSLCEYILQGVHCLISGDTRGTLKVWDMNAGTLLQTIEQAHGRALTGCLAYQEYIITSALDGAVRVWKSNPAPAQDAIFIPQPVSEYREAAAAGNGPPKQDTDAVLTLAGTMGSSGLPWLMVSRQHSNCVELVQMNDQFTFGGTLARVTDARCIFNLEAPTERLICVGCSNGHVVVYSWKQQQQM